MVNTNVAFRKTVWLFWHKLILKFLSTFQSFFISKHNFSLIIWKYKAKKNYWLVFFLKFTSESRKNIAWESNQNKYTSVISYLWRTCIFCLVESEKLSKIKELSTIQNFKSSINVRKWHWWVIWNFELLITIFFKHFRSESRLAYCRIRV